MRLIPGPSYAKPLQPPQSQQIHVMSASSDHQNQSRKVLEELQRKKSKLLKEGAAVIPFPSSNLSNNPPFNNHFPNVI